MEALGLGVEVSPHSHVAIIGRAAGFPGEIADHSVAAGGLRVDPLIDVTAGSLYVTGLIGWARCNRPALDGPTDCVEDDWFGALAGIAGAEIRLGGNSSWYAGIEGGYWWGMGRGAASEAVDHLTFAATLRFRPSM
jgi:hypothetical protein